MQGGKYAHGAMIASIKKLMTTQLRKYKHSKLKTMSCQRNIKNSLMTIKSNQLRLMKMSKPKLLLTLSMLAVCCLLAGCSSSTPLLTKPIRLSPPSELMQPCPALPIINDNANLGDLLQHDIAAINLYGECQIRLKALQKWIKNN